MCLAIHTTNISQFAATFNDARNQEIHRSCRYVCMRYVYIKKLKISNHEVVVRKIHVNVKISADRVKKKNLKIMCVCVLDSAELNRVI
jgi:hypothetical protein